MKHTTINLFNKWFLSLLLLIVTNTLWGATKQMEQLDRGVVAVKVNNGVFLSWRFLGTDKSNVGFNIYRDGTKINDSPITTQTNYLDANGSTASKYVVKAVNNNIETESSSTIAVWQNQYKTITLRRPNGGSNASGDYSYFPNDMSVGDVDGDGQYELFVKWDPNNSQDNSKSGYTGNVYIDCYELDGTFLWRIDLGINIRAGAHYTQFQVYDYDGDGKAEMVCKTAPGSKDGKGKNIIMNGDNPSADYRNSGGYILSGPEYLTIFEGATGAEINTIAYNPGRGNVSNKSTWGDNYGNRCDRFLACTAYLDGVHPSVVMCRGYYTQSNLVAYDFKNGKLVQRWEHHSTTSGQGAYGEGYHNLSVADVDDDGYDEIIYGSACIDHDGRLYYRTGFGHGDAMHVSDLDPSLPGLEGWFVHEEMNNQYGFELRNLKTGKVIFGEAPSVNDNGRGMSADIDATHRGFECWSSRGAGVYDCKGNVISTTKPSINFRIYWDGDLQDELLDGTTITKWNGKGVNTLITLKGSSINGTKANPCLSADILGDWREEVITYNNENPSEIFIYTTTIESKYRLFTPMHDAVYRCGVAWQNTAYNQPPHLGFYIGDGISNISQPDIYVVGGKPIVRDTATIGRKGSGGARNQTIMVGNSMNATIFTYTNADKLTILGALPYGVTAKDENGTLTVSGTPTMVGTYIYTLQTEGPNVNVEGPGGTITVVADTTTTKPKVAYITDPQVANYVNDIVLLPTLKESEKLYVVEVDAQQTNIDFSQFDMVIISEVAASNAPIMSQLKGISLPVLNMKVHAYKTSNATWSWATSGYGDNMTDMTLAINEPNHPIFAGIKGTEVNLISSINNKGYTYMNPSQFNSVEGEIKTLATIKGADQVCIFEAEAGSVISGTKLTNKYIQIGINSSSLGNLTKEGVSIVENACHYLLGMEEEGTCIQSTPKSCSIIYPNPIGEDGQLNILLEKASDLPLEIINMQGQVMYTQTLQSKETTLQLESLPSGNYILRTGEEAMVVRKR